MGGPRDPHGYSLGQDASRKVAERIKALMASHRPSAMKQIELARRMDLPQPHLSNLLTGSRRFQRWHVQRAAAALGVGEDELVGGLGTAPANPQDQKPTKARSESAGTVPPNVADFIRRRGHEFAPEQLEFLAGGLRWPGLEFATDDELVDLVRRNTAFLIRAAQRRPAR